MTNEALMHWRHLLGVKDSDEAPDVDEAIRLEFASAEAENRRPFMSRVMQHLGLQPDQRWQ